MGGGRDGSGKNRGWVELLLAAPALWACTGEDSCFVAATLIATPRGPRPIGSLRCGDSVWSHDPTQGLVERRVEAVHCAQARVICRLEVGGVSLLGVTPSHPIYDAAAQRYTELRELNAASRLLVFCDGVPRTCSIDRIHIEEAPEPVFEVYNLTVEGPFHNYVADGVLVHNKSPIPRDEFFQSACGNRVIDSGESCDDGNQSDGDGCSRLCGRETLEPVVPPPEHCQAGLSFSDAVLERVVRNVVGVPEGELTLESVSRIRHLVAYDEAITDLAGLECFTGLRGLELVRGQIADLAPLAGLTDLLLVKLSGQRIENLAPLSGLTQLGTLDIADNAVSDLTPLAGLTLLSNLDAAENGVVDLTPLASMPRLERLVLSGNQIGDLAPLRSLPVSFLVLNDNPLAGIEPLAELPTLAHLSIDHTGQSELSTLVALEGLSILSAVGNGISDLSFVEELPNLSDLRFQDNLITDLGPLVRASGVGKDDRVFLRGNAIDCAAQSASIDALRESSVFVDLDCE